MTSSKHKRPPGLLLALVVILALFAAACGNDDGHDQDDSTPTTTEVDASDDMSPDEPTEEESTAEPATEAEEPAADPVAEDNDSTEESMTEDDVSEEMVVEEDEVDYAEDYAEEEVYETPPDPELDMAVIVCQVAWAIAIEAQRESSRARQDYSWVYAGHIEAHRNSKNVQASHEVTVEAAAIAEQAQAVATDSWRAAILTCRDIDYDSYGHYIDCAVAETLLFTAERDYISRLATLHDARDQSESDLDILEFEAGLAVDAVDLARASQEATVCINP